MTHEELDNIIESVLTTHKEQTITVRQLLEAFNAYRRTSGNSRMIDTYLNNRNVRTVPYYNDVWWLDENIQLQEVPQEPLVKQKSQKTLSPQERVDKIISKSRHLIERITKIKKADVNISTFADTIGTLHSDLLNVLSDNNIAEKIKTILNYKLFSLEGNLNNIDSFSKKNHVNLTRIKKNIKFAIENIRGINFTIGTFRKLEFLNKNLVAIGANGCGKTSLAENIKRYITTNCVVIGAQKLLLVPKLNGVLDLEYSQKHLKEQQAKNKSLKQPLVNDTDESELKNSIADDIADEFSAVLNNLLSLHNSEIHRFANDYCRDNTTIRKQTLLEKVFELWKQIMPHLTLKCEDGINIMVQSQGKLNYPAYQLSDGEKVALYLIANVLQTPNDSYIIVDEPETYLHKSIVNKLWDMLELERSNDNCTFVYLTHNIDFAESRHAKKIWIKSYDTKEALGWDIQEIPNNEIPQELLMEILGSRRPILFCEGVKEKNEYSDAQIYEILYPQYTICSLGSCSNVINYTRAFNKIPNNIHKAYGIIDADFRKQEQKNKLYSEGIYAINVSEVENLFLDETFLKGMAEWFHIEDCDNVIEQIKDDIKKDFSQSIEQQIANYVSAKIDYIFKEENVEKANKKADVSIKFNSFCEKIKIDEWIAEREEYLKSITNDYNEIIKVYNNKGLKRHVNKGFNIPDFSQRAFNYLKNNVEAQNVIKTYFPSALDT